MAKLLYVETSPRKQRSASIEVARAFLDAYRHAHPADSIQEIDVWNIDLPEFDEVAFEAKYAGIEGRERTPAQAAVWDRFVALAQPFRDADKIVFAVPMWNWGIPYKLKHLIDVISMKDVLFTFDERGLVGLLGGKKALLVLAKGVDYSAGSATAPWDQQTPYLKVWLNSIGITDITVLPVEKNLYGPEVDRSSRDTATASGRALAASF